MGYEIYSRRELLTASSHAVYHVLLAFVPQLYSLLLFLAGALLLISGSIPANSEILESLRDVVPLPIVELSHLSGSLAGILLLFLARGILLRIDAAWVLLLLCLKVSIGMRR